VAFKSSDDFMRFVFGSWAKIESSNVAEATYDEKFQTLYIGFHGGRPQEGIDYYAYPGVPMAMAKSFMGAYSQGKWVWDFLRGRDGGHKWTYYLMEKNKRAKRARR